MLRSSTLRSRAFVTALVIASWAGICLGQSKSDTTKVVLKTSLGEITVTLFNRAAPITVKNFLAYVDSGFFNGTIFHRVIPGFMIQGGGHTKDMGEKATFPPIKNESDNRLKNERGTLSMARTSDPHSATSQFFINLVNNAGLDYGARGSWGYAVFGKVIQGMDVVDKIARVPTESRGQYNDVPKEPVIIISAKRKR
jgi:peptidyl-prolyl cis-trans isomerase A (cyclophilin A)